MTHGAKLTLKYDSNFEYTTYCGDDMLPEEHITMEIPAEDLSTMQLFRFFSNFLRSIGHNEYGIMKGACNLAFNEMNNEDDMKKLAHEFDLVMEEHIDARIKVYEELAENWEKRYWDLRGKMQKQQIKDCMPPWGHSDMEALRYTDEELNAMCDAAEDKESCKEMTTRELEWANKALTCDKDDKSKECEDAWGKFWNDDHSKALTYDEMIAEGYEMTADGFWVPGENMKVTTNNPMLAWNGLIPGSKEAVKKGCKCPVMDNAEMPEDRKWVNGDCPLHGKAK